jgi:guanosine-3',5'-bis(diphosphate) 3'-pyrophosphohydrolase
MTQHILAKALTISMRAHAKQFDKSGDPYIFHVLDVWQMIRSEHGSVAEQIVALLHDIVEDTPVSIDMVRASFGETVADAVDAITKRKGETRDAYLARVTGNPIALKVKWADACNNYSHLDNIEDEAERERLVAKYQHTLKVLNAARGEQ